jgi:hypothetical protein
MTNKFQRDTIGDISRRSASRYPDEPAVIFRGETLTFSGIFIK